MSTLADVVERLDKKLSSFLDSSSFPSVQQQLLQRHLYTQVASPSPVSVQKNTTPRSSSSDGHELNVIMFGLPDEGSIVDGKKILDEMFEFLSGKQLHIKILFVWSQKQPMVAFR